VVADADVGEIVTPLTEAAGGGAAAAVTVTLADPDLLVSAALVAVTVSVPAFAGAVYKPAPVMAPNVAFHVTDLLVVDPATVAANVSVPPVIEVAGDGDTVTELTAGAVGFVGAAVTVIVAIPVLVESAALVAVTVSVPAFAGAV